LFEAGSGNPQSAILEAGVDGGGDSKRAADGHSRRHIGEATAKEWKKALYKENNE